MCFEELKGQHFDVADELRKKIQADIKAGVSHLGMAEQNIEAGVPHVVESAPQQAAHLVVDHMNNLAATA
jgi:predicted oxidoreductase